MARVIRGDGLEVDDFVKIWGLEGVPDQNLGAFEVGVLIMVFYHAASLLSPLIQTIQDLQAGTEMWPCRKEKALILCAAAFRNRNLDVLVAVHHNNQGDQDNFQASMRATADVVCVWTHLIMGCNDKTPWKWTQAKFVWNKKRGAGYPNAPCIIHLYQDGGCLT